MITLYDYFRSSSAYRVRIALYLKGLDFKSIHVDLLKSEQNSSAYKQINPQGVVPYIVDGDVEMSESLAIMEYLDEAYGDTPPLIYSSATDRAYIRQLSLLIASGVHPFTHPAVWKGYLQGKLECNEEQAMDWYNHWTHKGFAAYEGLLNKYGKSGLYSLGNKISMADLCLIPQIYNARRFNMDLSAYPNITAIEKNCIALEAFQKASPELHPDAPSDLESIHGPKSALLAAA